MLDKQDLPPSNVNPPEVELKFEFLLNGKRVFTNLATIVPSELGTDAARLSLFRILVQQFAKDLDDGLDDPTFFTEEDKASVCAIIAEAPHTKEAS